MKVVLGLGVIWATLVVGLTMTMCALGYGHPNLSAGESVTTFWAFLWMVCFAAMPVAIYGAAAMGCAVSALVRYVTK
jgi:hypothetical protein